MHVWKYEQIHGISPTLFLKRIAFREGINDCHDNPLFHVKNIPKSNWSLREFFSKVLHAST